MEAAGILRGGGVVAFPTETVYGLGASVFDEAAVARIFDAKQRPADNPLIAHISSIDQLEELASAVPGSARKLIDAFFPGPLTVVLPKFVRVPEIATAGLDTIGVRMPGSELARRFLKACGVPVVAPSANLSGRPSPTTWQAVMEDLDGRIDCILKGDPTEIGLESTVVDCTGDVPVVLRAGAVSLDQLRRVVPDIAEHEAGTAAVFRSPGLRHRHYSPRANVRLVHQDRQFEILDPRSSAFIGLRRPRARVGVERICGSIEEYAHSLFEFFRECDRRGIDTIYCEAVDETGIGIALMDRIRRAAEGPE